LISSFYSWLSSSSMLSSYCLSILFPYTSLFRSHARARAGARPGLFRDVPGVSPRHPEYAAPCRAAAALALSRNLGAHRAVADLEDRKSTRLNSSHVKISYAVFCLKKKMEMNTRE